MTMIARLMPSSQRVPQKILSSTKFWGCLDYCLENDNGNCQQNSSDNSVNNIMQRQIQVYNS